jgi:hypothetical protein
MPKDDSEKKNRIRNRRSLANSLTVIKTRKVRQARHITCIGENRKRTEKFDNRIG